MAVMNLQTVRDVGHLGLCATMVAASVVITAVMASISAATSVMNFHALVPVTDTGATWGCVSLDLPGVMVTGIVQTAVTSYLDVLALVQT